jgi:hypothetical protein
MRRYAGKPTFPAALSPAGGHLGPGGQPHASPSPLLSGSGAHASLCSCPLFVSRRPCHAPHCCVSPFIPKIQLAQAAQPSRASSAASPPPPSSPQPSPVPGIDSLDLRFSVSLDSVASPQEGNPASASLAPEKEDDVSKDALIYSRLPAELKAKGALRSMVVVPHGRTLSYRDAIVSNPGGSASHNPSKDLCPPGHEPWSLAKVRRSSVMSRLGHRRITVHERLGGHALAHLPPAPTGSDYKVMLHAKAYGRCFNCFARDHRIS